MNEVTVNVRDFVRAGGKLSLAEWVTLDEREREACVTAGDELAELQAERVVSMIVDAVRQAVEEHRLESLIGKAEEMVT
ncbi:MAG: hypothetical protein DRQ55_17520 [Planctomycetota bacterium]|nr:MAG: hypothetical protein DRQ55_17520 [Planctomycetota bacterium]